MFAANSFGQYFQNAYSTEGKLGYIRAHYDATGFCSPASFKANENIWSRLRNSIVAAINAQVILPKAMIIVLERDAIEAINHTKPGFSILAGKIIEWLFNQIHRLIVAHKELLPSRSRKFKYPTILWVSLVKHQDWGSTENEYIDKFNTCLKNTASLFREMEVLDLNLDETNRSFITRRRFNASGLCAFWHGINTAFQTWDRLQMKNSATGTSIQQTKGPSCGVKPSCSANKYREVVTKTGKFNWKPDATKFRLPKPPAQKK